MKKSVIALLLLAVLVIIVSPGIVGKLAEDSVGENINRAADGSGELMVTSEGFDRGWFSSEGQHRVEIGDGQIRTLLMDMSDNSGDGLPVLVINTRIDHGIIPVSSMSRDEGSLAPRLGSAVSTLTVDFGDGEVVALPGAIYSDVGLGGDLDSRYALEAGSQEMDGGVVTWEPVSIEVQSSTSSGDVAFDGEIGAMSFGNDSQTIGIDGLTFSGDQRATGYGYSVGDFELQMNKLSANVMGVEAGGVESLSVQANSTLDGDRVNGTAELSMGARAIPNLGDLAVESAMRFDGFDAEALGKVSQRLEEMGETDDPAAILGAAGEEFKDLFAAGFTMDVEKLNVEIPGGTVETAMSFEFPASDRASFQWTSLLLETVAQVDVKVPEALVQMATSMDPQFGMIVAAGYLKKEGDAYVMDADFEKGLLTVNGAPIPIPFGAF